MSSATFGVDFVICPFDGNVFPKGTLNSVPEDNVMESFAEYARDLLGKNLEPTVQPNDDRELVDNGDEGLLTGKALYAQLRRMQAEQANLSPGGRRPWYVLPCGDNYEHMVPYGYIEATEQRRASVIALVGSSGSGKTHVLSAAANRLYSNQVLNIPPLLVESSVHQVRGHWDVFKYAYIDPLFEARRALQLTQREAEQYTSFLMVCDDGSRGQHSEWLVMTDCRGEATSPQSIIERGKYLASADTIVLCVDGQAIVELLGRRTGPVEEAALDDLLGVGLDDIVPLPAATGPEPDTEPKDPWTEPLDYCVSVSQFLDSDEVRSHRETIRKAIRPNVIVAITKADALEQAFRLRMSSLRDEIRKCLAAEPAKEVNLPFVWERHRLVGTILVAAGLGALVQSVSRRFPHPIFTMVSATGCAAVNENGVLRFPSVNPQGVDSLVINHLLSRQWFRTDMEARFGPED